MNYGAFGEALVTRLGLIEQTLDLKPILDEILDFKHSFSYSIKRYCSYEVSPLLIEEFSL